MKAVTASGVSWIVVARFSAVTMTSSSKPSDWARACCAQVSEHAASAPASALRGYDMDKPLYPYFQRHLSDISSLP